MNEVEFYHSEIDGLKWGMFHMPNVPDDVPLKPRKCYEPIQFTQVEPVLNITT